MWHCVLLVQWSPASGYWSATPSCLARHLSPKLWPYLLATIQNPHSQYLDGIIPVCQISFKKADIQLQCHTLVTNERRDSVWMLCFFDSILECVTVHTKIFVKCLQCHDFLFIHILIRPSSIFDQGNPFPYSLLAPYLGPPLWAIVERGSHSGRLRMSIHLNACHTYCM